MIYKLVVNETRPCMCVFLAFEHLKPLDVNSNGRNDINGS